MLHANANRKAVVKNTDMAEEMQQGAVDICEEAMEKYTVEKDIAAYLKKEMDKRYGPTWHCVVGRNFGSYVTHETHSFVYFYLGQSAVLLFKSG
ncbi:Dynein light chain [Paragonimus heterotremus]|uniref:Dynein light chain n=1 Tax=Paragonimus heterotremus TaxID=100268 RepID=A0A8J4SYN7_9TREM|nr:Dynein light chain [Paragonimus heterotremus]